MCDIYMLWLSLNIDFRVLLTVKSSPISKTSPGYSECPHSRPFSIRRLWLLVSHPDKVKATANLTMEAIQDRFVELTRAYKA